MGCASSLSWLSPSLEPPATRVNTTETSTDSSLHHFLSWHQFKAQLWGERSFLITTCPSSCNRRPIKESQHKLGLANKYQSGINNEAELFHLFINGWCCCESLHEGSSEVGRNAAASEDPTRVGEGRAWIRAETFLCLSNSKKNEEWSSK